MPTSRLERLNKLFEGQPRRARPDSNKPHIADMDFMSKPPPEKPLPTQQLPATQQAPITGLADETPWKVPEVAQAPRRVAHRPTPTGRDVDLISSSEDDEYLAAFSSKPTNKESSSKTLQHSKLDHKPDPGDCGGLPLEDVDGNELTGRFCPLVLVAKFPYKYMQDTNDRVSKHFFGANKFYQRKWDIFYIEPPGSLMAKAILLLPLAQVQELIDEINRVFKSDILCPADPFVVSFFADGTPQPRRLGTSRSRDDVSNMETSIPRASDNYCETLEDLLKAQVADDAKPIAMVQPTERSFADFQAKMERILAATKKGKQVTRRKKNEDRFLRQQDWVKQLKLAQRFFGLRPKVIKMPAADTANSWSDQQKSHEQALRKCGLLLDGLDVHKALPYAFEKDVVFVCVDIEAYERDHRKVTEIGVSTLDTLDLTGLAPGEGGENWTSRIRSRHIRIRGREHLENKDFCPGNANSFQFGQSEWVKLDEAAEVVDQCFEYPFSVWWKKKTETDIPITCAPNEKPIAADLEHRDILGRAQQATVDPTDELDLVDPNNTAQNAAIKATVSQIVQGDPIHLAQSGGEYVPAQGGPRKRNVVFVGHDIGNEFEYLHQLGSQIFVRSRGTYPIAAMEINANGAGRSETLGTIIEALDTAVLYRVLVRETQNYSLARIMLGLGKTAWHLHNAGNDARYTLEALIGMCIKARLDEDQTMMTASGNILRKENVHDVQWNREVDRRVQERIKSVEQDIRDECEGWKKATTPPVELPRKIYTMEITDKDGQKVEVEDPWLMAQMSDNDQSPVGSVANGNSKWIEQIDTTNTLVYRDPASSGR